MAAASASALVAGLLGVKPSAVCGRGTGLDDIGLVHKIEVVARMLAAIYGAIFSAQILFKPVQGLMGGTRAVAKGDFGTRLPLTSRDEMGFLVHSFNDMTKRLRRAREETERSRQAEATVRRARGCDRQRRGPGNEGRKRFVVAQPAARARVVV